MQVHRAAACFFQKNNGDTWTQINEGLTDLVIYALAICRNNIFAASLTGIWKRPLSDPVIPVESISFSSRVDGNNVNLVWNTATETNNKGFEIQRSTDQINFITVSFVDGKGTTTERQDYSFHDKPTKAGTYYYRLKQIDFNGTFSYSEIIKVGYILPVKFALYQNYPNPFNPITRIQFSVPSASFTTIKVFNILGEELAVLVNEVKQPGIYEIEFDVTKYNLSNGVYFYELAASGYMETKKLSLIK